MTDLPHILLPYRRSKERSRACKKYQGPRSLAWCWFDLVGLVGPKGANALRSIFIFVRKSGRLRTTNPLTKQALQAVFPDLLDRNSRLGYCGTEIPVGSYITIFGGKILITQPDSCMQPSMHCILYSQTCF